MASHDRASHKLNTTSSAPIVVRRVSNRDCESFECAVAFQYKIVSVSVETSTLDQTPHYTAKSIITRRRRRRRVNEIRISRSALRCINSTTARVRASSPRRRHRDGRKSTQVKTACRDHARCAHRWLASERGAFDFEPLNSPQQYYDIAGARSCGIRALCVDVSPFVCARVSCVLRGTVCCCVCTTLLRCLC